ncbi:hypothetical protein PsB1_1593 [Candidatus Phycosocius spiralis]|uniref:Uncharacterized protein n=1 Tax=Candidatus Phycosocius spiralis TaxID=2815099 RepID=A0ABQ4PWJ8_9PROT|nr:hypothetical protein PsB1_1593 [Candidatus Phycosocius spiralis]
MPLGHRKQQQKQHLDKHRPPQNSGYERSPAQFVSQMIPFHLYVARQTGLGVNCVFIYLVQFEIYII